MKSTISPEVAKLLEELVVDFNHKLDVLKEFHGSAAMSLTRPTRRPEDLVLLAIAISNVTQGMDEAGQHGVAYSWEDIVVAELNPAVSAKANEVIELLWSGN